jgi:hypothetical protein
VAVCTHPRRRRVARRGRQRRPRGELPRRWHAESVPWPGHVRVGPERSLARGPVGVRRPGRRLRRLASGSIPAGRRHVTWDGLDESGHPAPSGLYVVRLRLGGNVFSSTLLHIQ